MSYLALIFSTILVLTACQHLPGGSSIGIEFQLGGRPPTAYEAAELRKDEEPVLINGTPVDKSAYPHVVRIFNGSSSCTASIVGPRALLTAAHCAETGDNVSFQTVDGKKYTARITRAAQYPAEDLDLAMGLVSQQVAVKPVSVRIDRFEKKNMEVQLIGYGCVKPGGGGGNDGILREGKSRITGGQGFDLVLNMPDGAALCYGDSGGPVFYEGKQIAVNSKGNIADTSYVTRTTLPEGAEFLKSWSEKNGAPICGVTSTCDGAEPPPSPKTFRFENDAVFIEGRVK